MNKPIEALLLQPAEAFADYLKNAAARIDEGAEAIAAAAGARVGISRPHESAQLHVAGEATYIDDIPELAGTLHCALGLSPVAAGRLTATALDNCVNPCWADGRGWPSSSRLHKRTRRRWSGC